MILAVQSEPESAIESDSEPDASRLTWAKAFAARARSMAIHVGTSGWSYDHWVDILYPRNASSLERLQHTLEVIPASFKTAFEFRHPSWHTEPVLALLERHRAAYCV